MTIPFKKFSSFFLTLIFSIQTILFFSVQAHAQVCPPAVSPVPVAVTPVAPISPSILFSDTSPAGAGTQFRDYAYDPIGNRTSVSEGASAGNYSANNLNQYDQVDLLFEDPAVLHKSVIFQQVSSLNSFHTFFTKRSFGFHATAL